MSLIAPATGMPDPMVLTSWTPELIGPPVSGGNIGGSQSANLTTAYFYPVRLSQARTYTTAWWVNGATVAGNIDVGIYTRSGTTLTRVAASTAQAQAGVSVMQIATTFPTTTIGPGLYYLAYSSSTSTGTFWTLSLNVQVQRQLGAFQTAASNPLPATATAAIVSSVKIPLFGFSESATI